MIQDIAPHNYDITYRNVTVKDNDVMLIYRNNQMLCCMDGDEIEYPKVSDIAEVCNEVKEKAKFLFRIDDNDYFELRKLEIEPFGKWRYLEKDRIREIKPMWKAFAAITGFQIHNWYTNTKFCGRCGTKMSAPGNERAMKCPECGKIYYPQICPSVIVGVTDGDKLLMTKYAARHSTYRRYALIAGYGEVGESLEATVIREVEEEVGLRVKNIRYFASQPWSFSDTLLVGFFCDVEGSREVTLDEDELSVAEWLTREEIPEESANSSFSLTGAMIKAFKDGEV